MGFYVLAFVGSVVVIAVVVALIYLPDHYTTEGRHSAEAPLVTTQAAVS